MPKSRSVVADHVNFFVERSRFHVPSPDPSMPSRKRSSRTRSSNEVVLVTPGLCFRLSPIMTAMADIAQVMTTDQQLSSRNSLIELISLSGSGLETRLDRDA